MRIIAGTMRGRSIETPKGLDTRPTTDRVREALMSSLYSLRGTFEGAVVLDAFAGSGALGLEALSRGADEALFCDCDRRAIQAVQRNIASFGLSPDVAQALQRDVVKAGLPVRSRPFDLVFLDPPYAMKTEDVLSMVDRWASCGAVADGALVVYEHSAAAEAAHDAFEVAARKRYGKTAVTIGRWRTGSADSGALEGRML